MMNDAFAALQRMKASKVAQVSGVLSAPAPAASTPSSPHIHLVPPTPTLGALEALARRSEAGKEVVTEARRISALPTWDYADLLSRCQPGGDLDYTERFRAPGGTMTLKPIQNLALHWVEQKKGLVGPLAVGSGKTLLSLLAAPVMGAMRPVLMIPPALQIPLHHEIARLKKHFRIPLNLYILPYSQLSVAKSTDLLEQIKPDLIIADECFPAETLVETDVGAVPIGDIVNKGTATFALAFDVVRKTFEWRRIVRRMRKNLNKPLVRVVADGYSFVCTEDHKVWVEDAGYVKAKYLREGDVVCALQGMRDAIDVDADTGAKRENLLLRGVSGDGCGSGDAGSTPPYQPREDMLRVCKALRAEDMGEGCTGSDYLLHNLSREEVVSGQAGGAEAPIGSSPARDGSGPLHRVRERLSDYEEGKEHRSVLLGTMPERCACANGGMAGNEAAACGSGSQPRAQGRALRKDEQASGEAHLPRVRGDVLTSFARREAEHGTSVLLPQVRGEVSWEPSSRHEAGTVPCFLPAYAREQPDAATRGGCEDARGAFWSDLPRAGGKRKADTGAEGRGGSPRPPDGARHSDAQSAGDVSESASLLQGGCCMPGVSPRHRNRREVAPHKEVALSRRSQDFCLVRARVARVEVYEREGAERPVGSVDGDSCVYDLEVEDHHNYVANGVVVSNCHMVRNPDSARTRRVLRYFRQFPQTRFIALSGTLTAKELKDYAHLCELALRDGSPVPLTEADLLAWGNCLDANGIAQDKDWSIFAAFHDVRHLDHDKRRDAARDAFRERFNSAPGVVATREASVSCSLNLFERDIAPPMEVTSALAELHKTWTRPDGEEMDSALSLWRLGMQMTQGFYLRWVWPEGKVDHEWMEARSSWHREVRYVLQRNLAGMDSPLLVWNAVQRGQLDHPSIVRAFHAWSGQKHKPPPPTETVWLSDYLVRDALAWHREHPKGIIWHSDLATENALRAAGVPTYGAGETPPLDGSRGGLALSIRVHGTGLNLQYAHHENLILSFPSSGKTMEQLLGRTHRQGQDADEVTCWYYVHTDAARDAFRNARESARYIEQTQGSPQKLCYATYA